MPDKFFNPCPKIYNNMSTKDLGRISIYTTKQSLRSLPLVLKSQVDDIPLIVIAENSQHEE